MNLPNMFLLIILFSICPFCFNQESTNFESTLLESTDLLTEETKELSIQDTSTLMLSNTEATTSQLLTTKNQVNFSTQISSELITQSEKLTSLFQTIVSNQTDEKSSNMTSIKNDSTTIISNETCETLNQTITTTATTEATSISEFNTFMEISGLIRNKRKSSAKIVLVKSNKLLFIENTNITNVEQAILNSLGKNATLSVRSIENDEYSIDISLTLNTASNSELSLDDSLLEIIDKLESDEQKINDEANKAGFDLNVDAANAFISANETLLINGTTYLLVCKKSPGDNQMNCERAVQQENGTFLVESNNEIKVVSLAFKLNFSAFLLFITFFIINGYNQD